MKIVSGEGYRLYNEMINGYNTVNENKFVHGAMYFAAMDLKHPFQHEEGDMYYSMMVIQYKKWLKRGVDYRVSKRRLLHAAEKLAELDLPCPFIEDAQMNDDVSFEQISMNELITAEQEDIASGTYVPVQHVLGVMPESEVE